MAQSGSVADKWIACDLVLADHDELSMAAYRIFDRSQIHRIEFVAELDTDCCHLGLSTYHVKALKMHPVSLTLVDVLVASTCPRFAHVMSQVRTPFPASKHVS